jgi:hypothetical protein
MAEAVNGEPGLLDGEIRRVAGEVKTMAGNLCVVETLALI